MKFISNIGFAVTSAIILLSSGCTAIDITEQSFLRDKQQAILYSLIRHGASNTETLAERTFYRKDAIVKTLERLQEEKLVTLQEGQWQISVHYREQENEYVSAIKNFSLNKVQSNLPSHEVKVFNIPNSTTMGAAFITPNATESLLVFPGNGFTLVPNISEVAKLVSANRNVLVLEYPGMGDSEGELTVNTLKQAAEHFTAYTYKLNEVKDTRVILYGFSLGGFVATHASTLLPVDALILDSTAPDMQRWVDKNIPLYAKAFVDVKVDTNLSSVSNIALIREAEFPMLFIAGGKDTITPPDLVQELFNAAKKARMKKFEVLTEVDHGGSLDAPEFSLLVNDFLNKVSSFDPASNASSLQLMKAQ